MTSSRSRVALLVFLLTILAACSSAPGGPPARSSPPATTASPPATTAPSPSPTGDLDGASGAPAVDAPMEQRDEGGGVTVKATWVGSTAGIAFEVALDTHSVDLDGLDLRGASLRNGSGATITGPIWDADKGGHHRSGRLTFPGDPGTFLASTTWIELLVPDVAGVPVRTLRWTVHG
ncbi:MAG TPA: hypothetical protein VGK17_21365 [Propionicimonas sp.]